MSFLVREQEEEPTYQEYSAKYYASFVEPQTEKQQIKDDWCMEKYYGNDTQNDYQNSPAHYSKPASEIGIYIVIAILILGGMFLAKMYGGV